MIKLLKIKQVIDMTGLSRSTIYKYISENKFPGQIRIGYRSVAWQLHDLELWLDGCKNNEYFKYK
jgi:prophage regulatory protein